GFALSSRKACLRELEERARAVREALALGRQSVLLLGGHLAECKIETIRQEHRIVAKTFRPTRRPNERTIHAAVELLHVAIRPGDREHRDEMGVAAFRREGVALAQAGLD